MFGRRRPVYVCACKDGAAFEELRGLGYLTATRRTLFPATRDGVSKPMEEVIASALRISPSAVTDALAFNAIPEWDSLAHVELMLALEAEYGVSIDEDHMIELMSVRKIREFLGNGGASA